MDSTDPTQPGSGSRKAGAGSRRGLPLRSRGTQVLTAAAVSLALAGAAATYSSVETGPVAVAVAPSEPPVTVMPPVATPPAAASTAPSAAQARGAGTAGFSPAFDAAVDAIIEANSQYAVGVALIHVKDGALRQYGDTSKFLAASTAKILAAAAYYRQVETGRASLTTPMGSSTAGIQIRQMVQQSNNDSWALILNALGQRALTAYAASLGISYDFTANLLTPAETAKTLFLLYSGKLLNRQDTGQLLSYMQGTNYEALIPAAVPPGIKVFHKYGLLSGNLHDASILVQGGKAYVFVVYTLGQDGTDIPARTRIIHDLTQTVIEKLF